MSGIAGYFSRSSDGVAGEALVREMLQHLKHRGPDDEGVSILGGVGLGCRRLAIVDPTERSNQPVTNERGSIHLVHNGEIYNYRELRAQLRSRGHDFRSDGDAEVIVHAYEEWGTACVQRFNGMWAFALWDAETRRLFCSRDRFGIKPFYYFDGGERFVFGSEIKAIIPAMAEAPQANLEVLGEFLLTSDACHRSETFYQAVRSLPAGHSMLVDQAGTSSSRYWDYESQSQDYDFSRPAETVGSLLEQAVRLRSKADVPIGIALSGGLDSTALLADSGVTQAFTAVFPGHLFDERKHAEAAARHFSVDLHCLEYQPANLVEDLESVIWHMDYPSPEAQVLPRFKLMQLASENVKGILEGQGADELFGGYPNRYLNASVADDLGSASLPRWMSGLRSMHGYLSPLRAASLGPRLRALDSWQVSSRWKAGMVGGLLSEEFQRELGARAPRRPPIAGGENRLTQRLIEDHARDLLPRLLKFGDSLSMAASIEARVPFLDHRLVEFVTRLPGELKVGSGFYKKLLWQSQENKLPPETLLRRDKIGFATPISQWIAPLLEEQILIFLQP